ncbi:MAG: ester cyclase [Candidatus Devosia phytovorans]|uniref:Ester cyclase n=1 Tax=Candidatus Devosia phytovorans TaxID=3121372 RepID=A0AAJ5VYE5_9HYPH|nr:ester cyclase [Devosia sp.]WEK06150.1 MAG: ester cyclase [Devosia sp.]
MTPEALATLYRGYIDCLNLKDWAQLGHFVHENVQHNGRRIGLSGYREMLENDYRMIPDLRFAIDLLVSDPQRIAARLLFDCRPKGEFLGLPVNGQRVRFAENVFYQLVDERIESVWSIIDIAAIKAQLQGPV